MSWWRRLLFPEEQGLSYADYDDASLDQLWEQRLDLSEEGLELLTEERARRGFVVTQPESQEWDGYACRECDQPDGCTVQTWVDAGGILLERVPFSASRQDLLAACLRVLELEEPQTSPVLRRCKPCGVVDGELHHIGCPRESCLRCHLPIPSCGCLSRQQIPPAELRRLTEGLRFVCLAMEIESLPRGDLALALAWILGHQGRWIPRDTFRQVADILSQRGREGVCESCSHPGILVPCAGCGAQLHGHCHWFRLERSLYCWSCAKDLPTGARR